MTDKLQKCRSRNFAIGFVDRWMNLNVPDGLSMEQVKNTISTFLDKTFGQWKYVLVLYPPHNGGDQHYTNYDIRRFRFYGHNIVVHFLPRIQNSKACKDPEPIKWCSNHEKDYSGWSKNGFYCTFNDVDAYKWYNFIKNHHGYFGHLSALTVFRGNDFALAGQYVCLKQLSIERCYQCDPHHFPHRILTIIYA